MSRQPYYSGKKLVIYVVSSALIAINAVVCLSYGFDVPIRHWGGVVAYTMSFVAITTLYHYVIHLDSVQDRGLVFSCQPIRMTVSTRSESGQSVVAVDPAAGVTTE